MKGMSTAKLPGHCHESGEEPVAGGVVPGATGSGVETAAYTAVASATSPTTSEPGTPGNRVVAVGGETNASALLLQRTELFPSVPAHQRVLPEKASAISGWVDGAAHVLGSATFGRKRTTSSDSFAVT